VSAAEVPVVGAGSLSEAGGWQRLIDRALSRFGTIDAAVLFPASGSASGFCKGLLLQSDIRQLDDQLGYFRSTMHALQSVIPAMRRGGGGQILVFTSDAGSRPEAGWSIYGAVRAGQSFMVQAVALEHAGENICLNALGSKNVIGVGFPGAPTEAISDTHIAAGEWSAPLAAETPLGRVGTMAELAAFCLPLLDGSSRFQTAQYFSYSGGWNTARAQAPQRP
jgi:NAD(P)-dependent dehydrogenase (short-subunit alcohol dehydrogenase family)